jgi:hypothetical protein
MPSGPRLIWGGPLVFGLSLATSADLLRPRFAPGVTGNEKSSLTFGHFHVARMPGAKRRAMTNRDDRGIRQALDERSVELRLELLVQSRG